MSTSLFEQQSAAIARGELIAVATVIAGAPIGRKLLLWPDGRQAGSLGSPTVDAQVTERAAEVFQSQQAIRFTLAAVTEEEQEDTADVEIFLEVHVPPRKLIIVGAVHIAIPLVTFGKTLDFETLVLDARSAFATEERFHHADQLIIRWPADTLAEMSLDESTYLVFLTHDEKIDNPALAVALASRARYIGALGSRKTHGRRVEALRDLGVAEEAMARIHAPIGLNIGARRPEEIAVSIIAEIVQVMAS